MKRLFTLYPEEHHWFSFEDYGAVLEVMRRRRPRRLLEFGPGSSTLALVEGGAERIDTCEDDPKWATVYQERLVDRFPSIVRLHRYTWSDPISVPAVEAEQPFDLAFIDGPCLTPRRPPVIRYAMEHATAVLLPTEDYQREHSSFLRPVIHALADEFAWQLTITPTGPLSGSFALLVKPVC